MNPSLPFSSHHWHKSPPIDTLVRDPKILEIRQKDAADYFIDLVRILATMISVRSKPGSSDRRRFYGIVVKSSYDFVNKSEKARLI